MATPILPSSARTAQLVDTRLEEASTAELLKEAVLETRELVRIEVELARAEVKVEIEQAKRAAIGFGVAAGASIMVLCLLAMALVLALGGTALVALCVAGVFVLIAAAAGLIGYSLVPKKPFERTRERLEVDVNQLKEHIA